MNIAGWLRQRRLLRRLRRGARLLREGLLAPAEYAALAVRIGYDLQGKPLQCGAEVNHFEFGIRLMDHTVTHAATSANIQRSLEVYGPYNEAVVTLEVGCGIDSGPWTSTHENLYQSARRKLNPLVRRALTFEGWYAEQRRLFPFLSDRVEKLLYWVAGLLIGFFVGRLWP